MIKNSNARQTDKRRKFLKRYIFNSEVLSIIKTTKFLDITFDLKSSD